jgi:hypothetical protein
MHYDNRMDLVEIQDAIEELPKDQQVVLTAWLAERDQAAWEAEIERDSRPEGAPWRSWTR